MMLAFYTLRGTNAAEKSDRNHFPPSRRLEPPSVLSQFRSPKPCSSAKNYILAILGDLSVTEGHYTIPFFHLVTFLAAFNYKS